MNSGSNSGSEVSDTPAIAENAVVAANRASSAPRSERSVRIFSHSECRTAVKDMSYLLGLCGELGPGGGEGEMGLLEGASRRGKFEEGAARGGDDAADVDHARVVHGPVPVLV